MKEGEEMNVKKTLGVKESFERGQQSQMRFQESFKYRLQLEKEESIDESEFCNDRKNKLSQSNLIDLRQAETNKKNKKDLRDINTESSPLQSGIASRYKQTNNLGMSLIIGDNDSPIQADIKKQSKNSFSSIDSISKIDKHDKTNNQLIKRTATGRLEANSKGLEKCSELGEDISEKDSKDNNDYGSNNKDEILIESKFVHEEKSPVGSKQYGRRGSRRPIGGNTTGMTKEQNTTSIKENMTEKGLFQQKGGFFFALKMKKFANQLVSRLQSRRYLGLRSKHLQFFNDGTIVPDEEKGIFKHNHGEDDMEESDDTYPSQTLDKRCTFFLKSVYKKLASKRIKNFISKFPLFSPSHTAKLLWDFLNMISIAYYLIFFPLRVTFGLSLFSNPFSYIALFVIISDILVHLNTGFYDKGVLVTDRIHILINYFSNRIFHDLISLIPFIMYDFSDVSSNMLSNELKFLESMVSLLFLIRVSHLTSLKRKIEERFYEKKMLTHIFSLFSLLLNTLYIAHLFSCAWLVVGYFKQDTNNTWMNLANVDQDYWTIQYLYSLYFLIITMTTVGYGDIRAQNSLEHFLIIIIVLISSGVFSFSINQIGQIVQQMAEEKERVKSTLQVINNYMNKKNININLQQQIREYLEYYLKESFVNDNETEDKIIEMLSEPLKRSLMIEANKIALKDSPIFRNNFSETTISKTVALIQELRCTPEEVLFYEGDTDNPAIFFVQQGKVELFIDSYKSNEVQITSLKVFHKGLSFGEISFFTGQPRNISIRSIDFTTLLMIKRQDFLNVVKESSEDYENFCKIKDSLTFYKNYKYLGVKCLSCNSKNHVLVDCPYIHYVPDKEKIIKVFQLPVEMERQSFDNDLRLNSFNTYSNYLQIKEEAEMYVQNNQGYIDQQDWYDGITEEDEEEDQDIYQQYETQDDFQEEEERKIGVVQNLPNNGDKFLIQGDQRFLRKMNTYDQNQLNMHNAAYKDDSTKPGRGKEDGMNLNFNNYHPNIQSLNNLNSLGITNSSSSALHLNTLNNNNASPQISTNNTNLLATNANQLLLTGNNLVVNNSNNYETHSVKSLHRGNYDGEEKRERGSSNLGLNDLALTPSGLLLTLVNPNPGNIKDANQKNINMIKRKRSTSNSNLNNLSSTPNAYQKGSNLQNEDLLQFQLPERVLSGGPNNEKGQTNLQNQNDRTTAFNRQSSKTNSMARNNSRRKGTERTIRTNNKRLSTKMTLDSRLNQPVSSNGHQQSGGINERNKIKKLTQFRKGFQDNQISNTLLALQGMENMLLQNKGNNNSGEFDIMKCYEIYFPHNNIDIVIFQLRKKNPQLFAKQKSFVKSNTKRLIGGLTMNSTHNRMSKMDMVLQKFLMSEVDEEKDKESMQSARMKSFTGHRSEFYKTPKMMAANGGSNEHIPFNKRATASRKHSLSPQQSPNQNQMYTRGKSKTLRDSTHTTTHQNQNNFEYPLSNHDFPLSQKENNNAEALEILSPSRRKLQEFQKQKSYRKKSSTSNQNNLESYDLYDLQKNSLNKLTPVIHMSSQNKINGGYSPPKRYLGEASSGGGNGEYSQQQDQAASSANNSTYNNIMQHILAGNSVKMGERQKNMSFSQEESLNL